MMGIGMLPKSAQRVMVQPDQAESARRLLEEALVEEEIVVEEDAGGRMPRNFGLAGAYTRAWLVSVAVMGVAFGVFLLLRAV